MSQCNSRRQFLLRAGALGLTGMSGGALAIPMPAPENIGSAINDVAPLYKNVGNISGEWRTVRPFFSFTCNFSAALHKTIFDWGLSLPDDIKFLPTPVFGKNDDSALPGAIIFYALWMTNPRRLGGFMEVVYERVGGGTLDPNRIESYLEVVESMGIDSRRVAQVAKGEAVEKRCLEAIDKGSRFALQRTPSIGIGGRFLVTPDGVAGRKDLLVQLLNGLTSKMIIGMD